MYCCITKNLCGSSTLRTSAFDAHGHPILHCNLHAVGESWLSSLSTCVCFLLSPYGVLRRHILQREFQRMRMCVLLPPHPLSPCRVLAGGPAIMKSLPSLCCSPECQLSTNLNRGSRLCGGNYMPSAHGRLSMIACANFLSRSLHPSIEHTRYAEYVHFQATRVLST